MMSPENYPFTSKKKLKNKKRFRFFRKKNLKFDNENCKEKIFEILFFISLIGNILSFFYILNIKKKMNKSSIFIPSYANNIDRNGYLEQNEFPVLKISTDEKLEMCYKSRAIYYTKFREHNKGNIKLETIQSKISYLIVHESPDYKSKIVDKIGVHEYAKKVLGKDICVPILKIYNDANEINFDELPNQFVLKNNHGCGMNIIVNDKSKLNFEDAKNTLNKWKNDNFGVDAGEFQYINVNKKIFAETFLKDNIEDYKIYCFHGEPKLIRVQKKVESRKINNYYTLDWKLTDIETGLDNFYRDPNTVFEKPKTLELMIEYAKKLSAEFVFVRVDFYYFNDIIYLGEMTFTPSNLNFRLKNEEQSKYLGTFIDITKIKKYLFN